MNFAYASRTGNVESIIQQLNIEATCIESGNEIMERPFILFTYTDGFGDIPNEIDSFLCTNAHHLRGVIVSGDKGYGEAYCLAGDKIAETYNVDCLYKIENSGTDQDIENILEIIKNV